MGILVLVYNSRVKGGFRLKKSAFMIMTLFLLMSLSGCLFVTKEPYEFRQTADQIVSIEISKKVYDSVRTDTPTEVIRVLEKDEYQAFLNAVAAVPGNRMGLDPPTGFGSYIVKITYQDGMVELFGEYNNGYITPEGELHQDCYVFDEQAFLDMLSEFLEDEITEDSG